MKRLNFANPPNQTDYDNWICPDIRPYWKLSQLRNSNQFVLRTPDDNHQHLFSATEGYALRYFTGVYTVSQIQQDCHQKLGDAIASNLVAQLLQKLITLDILAPSTTPAESLEPKPEKNSPIPNSTSPHLKSCLQWIEHPNSHWILRNPEDGTFLQLNEWTKTIIEDLGNLPPNTICQKYKITPNQLRNLLQQLAATAMLEGTTPPKPRRGKFTPLQLLYFRIPLFNPDFWLTRHVGKLRWIWTRTFAFLLCLFLLFAVVIGLHQRDEIIYFGQKLLANYGASLLLPFVLLTMLVVSLHELGHAFTLKHYANKVPKLNLRVPEVGLFFMFLRPAAYTNTSDAYCLVKRYQRVLVVAAGVLCQLIIAAIALWLWNLTVPGSWLFTTSYLLMSAALFTVALNLNPLSKFDGYYLAVALTGINNLRSRSFKFYANLLRRQPIQERPRDCWILAAYAPFIFLYIQFVFGFLLYRVADWSAANIPTLALTLLVIWAIYFYFPNQK
ncbi:MULTISPECIES: M50 family metallopeptidase [unclassified Coleofasciculus]|uniref:M50 family metallopeptidase n=1 Tax=unclassified Coleofasciculus TaxID=2692782 RepID=UPI0018817F16|nr:MULTISPECIES: M50 family metallopeptidase [unclassified Coleofasciculus]MBE9129199.1 M50 family metallopeptidase [Coleofasciculus sp. LEGE 07081]MBE9151858.1 M50 family metallopeptidase [Coleofasciculus sp. LEGE 07092]